MKAVYVTVLALLSACTTPHLRDTSSIDAVTARCETEDCVIRAMDTLVQGPQFERYPFMDGFPDTQLSDLKSAGRLTVGVINPLFVLGAGVTGYIYYVPGRYGGMYSCDIRYLPGFNWIFLKHELAHCQGYEDHGIPLQYAQHTGEQQQVMAQEGVTKWTDTQHYRASGIAVTEPTTINNRPATGFEYE